MNLPLPVTGRGAKRKKGIKPLNPRQLAFIDEYMKDRNATQAYIRAGYSGKGADAGAARMLGNVSVSAEVERRKADLKLRHNIDLDEVVAGIKRLAFADLSKCYDDTGALLLPHQWPEDVRLSLIGTKTVEMAGGMQIAGKDGAVQHIPMYTKEVKLENRLPALKQLWEIANGSQPTTVTNNTFNVQLNAEQILLRLDAALAT